MATCFHTVTYWWYFASSAVRCVLVYWIHSGTLNIFMNKLNVYLDWEYLWIKCVFFLLERGLRITTGIIHYSPTHMQSLWTVRGVWQMYCHLQQRFRSICTSQNSVRLDLLSTQMLHLILDLTVDPSHIVSQLLQQMVAPDYMPNQRDREREREELCMEV